MTTVNVSGGKRVLKTLLESSARRRPNFFTTGVSAACHSLLIVAAIWFTARDGVAREKPDTRVQRLAPFAPTPSEPARVTRPNRVAVGAPSIRLPQVLDIPSVIPDPLPLGGLADPPPIGSPEGDGPAVTGGDAATTSDRPLAASEVDEAAQPLAGSLVPIYPEPLRRASVERDARIRFIVDTTGRVLASSVTVVSASHELFTAAARAAVLRARFKPARVRERVVQQLVEQPFSFRIRP
jgi:TonB family protein